VRNACEGTGMIREETPSRHAAILAKGFPKVFASNISL
jgi:hypothetical protein